MCRFWFDYPWTVGHFRSTDYNLYINFAIISIYDLVLAKFMVATYEDHCFLRISLCTVCLTLCIIIFSIFWTLFSRSVLNGTANQPQPEIFTAWTTHSEVCFMNVFCWGYFAIPLKISQKRCPIVFFLSQSTFISDMNKYVKHHQDPFKSSHCTTNVFFQKCSDVLLFALYENNRLMFSKLNFIVH
jgi:hypothetical protein